MLLSCMRDLHDRPRGPRDSCELTEPSPLSPSSSVSKAAFRRWSGSTTSFFHPSPPLPTLPLDDETGEPLPVGRNLQGLLGVGDDDGIEGVEAVGLRLATDSRTPIPPRASSLYSDGRLSRSYDMLQLYISDTSAPRRPPSHHWRRSIVSVDAHSVVSIPHQHLYILNPDQAFYSCVQRQSKPTDRPSCEELGSAAIED